MTFRDRKGRVRALPAAWTSMAPADPFVVISAGRSFFRADDLLSLAALVQEISEHIGRAGGVK